VSRNGLTRQVTINDVARTAGVSRAAVSKVIRDASGVSASMRERVLAAIEELGYRPSLAARALRGSSYRIGLEIPHLDARFMSLIADGAKGALVGTPYELVLAVADGPEYSAIEALVDGLVDGIIAVAPLVDGDWLETLASRLPIVMLGRHDSPENYDTVVGEDDVGARAVMSHLLSLGHRRIAHVTESEAVTAPGIGTPHAVRLQTYLDCMLEAGHQELVSVVRRSPGTYGWRASTARLLAGSEPPTAVFAGHDDIAFDVLAAVADSEHAPDKVAVVGYDNTPLAAHPLISLSSVDQSGLEMGAQAAAMLLERIAGRTEPRHHVVTPTLQVRASSRPADLMDASRPNARARERTAKTG